MQVTHVSDQPSLSPSDVNLLVQKPVYLHASKSGPPSSSSTVPGGAVSSALATTCAGAGGAGGAASPEARKRAEVLASFRATYELYERLFEPLSEAAFYMRADPLRHPLIFYYGHTACFFVNKLRYAELVQDRVNPKFESLFAIGVDEMSWDDLLPDGFDWPPVAEVHEYRQQVRAVVEEAIRTMPLELPITWDSPMWAVLMGIDHERIHLETSAVLIRHLPVSELTPKPMWRVCPFSGEPPANKVVPVLGEPTTVRLGLDRDRAEYYGWDMEYGKLEVDVQPFGASKFLVTNREFLEFMQDGGYDKRELWTEEGWGYVTFLAKHDRKHPRFWVPARDSDGALAFQFRTMLEEMSMPWDWPVEVNQLEAKAFCNWKAAKTGRSLRLPTEGEAEYMRQHEVPVDFPKWDRAPANINLEYYCSSTPVTAFAPSPSGLYDVIGNVWQHNETPIDAFPGFKVHRLYQDFSVPTFDTFHNRITGGSWISTGNEALPWARYGFRRHFYQFAGFRYVESDDPVRIREVLDDTEVELRMLTSMHYAPKPLVAGVPNFAVAVAELALKFFRSRKLPPGVAPPDSTRALDIGCGPGRSTFELAREMDYAIGIDFSATTIRKAVALQNSGSLRFTTPSEGELFEYHLASLEELDLTVAKDKCEFMQSDACNFDPRYEGYDLVLAADLLEQLYDPELFFSTIHERMRPGAVLVITSTGAWSTEFTPKERWLGGFQDAEGNLIYTWHSLQDILAKRFNLLHGPIDMPRVMQRTTRQLDFTITQASVWQLR